MRRASTLICLGTIASIGLGLPVASAQDSSPEATIREAYAATVRSLAASGPKTPPQPWEKPHRDRLMSRSLAALFARDETYTRESGEIGHVDADPFIGGQDGEVKNLRVGSSGRSGDKAVAQADFVSFGSPVTVRFAMVLEGGRWRIDDIVNTVDGKEFSTRAELAQPYPCGSFMKKRCPR